MSRSRYRTPIVPTCNGRGSCKEWRSMENRRYRAYVKNLMRHERYDDIQGYCGRFGNEWDSPRDGKHWVGDMKGRPCYVNYVCRMYGFTYIRDCVKDGHQYCHQYYLEMMRR